LLLLDRYAEGWQGYEWRRAIDRSVARTLAGPEWTGGDPAAKRLLLYCEQGRGDTIQFCRFAAVVAATGAEVSLEVQPPLRGLLTSLEGVKVIRQGEAYPEYDAHLPLMSLPHVMKLTPETMPVRVPYLFAEPDRIEAWARRLPTGKFRIGIA